VSEDDDTNPVSPEELGLDAALAVLAAPLVELEARLLAGDDAAAALRRQQLEALALLAWALPAEPASTRSRQQLIGRLVGDETVRVVRPIGERGPAPGPAPAASPLGVLDPPALPALAALAGSRGASARPAGPAAGPTAGAAPAPPSVRKAPAPAVPLGPPARRHRWALPLAALFALATLGIGVHDWRLGRQLDETERQLAAAQQERQQLAARLQAGEGAQAAALAGKARELEAQLAMLTSPGTLVCALRPSPGSTARRAGGVLYVADDHQHWYLRARNLPAPGEGLAYQLWFLVDDEPVHAGTFELHGDEAVMSSPTMPEGTTAALVTVEPKGAAAERPKGPVVLYGRDMKPLAS
jgi:hypothetical protein